MNLSNFLKPRKPLRPYVMRKGKPNKYNPTSMDGHRVLGSGAIVVRTLSVGGVRVGEDYDAEMQKIYNANMTEYLKATAK